MTLYNNDEIKIYILFLMSKLGYPISFMDLGILVTLDNTVRYFDYSRAFFDLLNTGHIESVPDQEENSSEKGENSEKYIPTQTGKIIVRSLSTNPDMAVLCEESYIKASRYLSLSKKGAKCSQSFESTPDGYIFHCSIEESGKKTMEISVKADSVYQLEKMRLNFDENPEVILRGLVALLTGNVNYLFN